MLCRVLDDSNQNKHVIYIVSFDEYRNVMLTWAANSARLPLLLLIVEGIWR